MGPFAGTDFLQALGWAVLNSLWQMAFLWTAYQLLSGTIVKRPSSRNLLATFLLTGGFAWFVYSFISLLQFNEPASVPGMTALIVNERVTDFFYTALPVASVVYLIFLVVPFTHYIRSYRYVRIIRSQGLHRASAEIRLFADKVGARMGIRKDVQVWLSDFVSSPVTIGYLKPIILLPVAALNQLSPSQAEAILLHELAHIRRYDYLVNLTVKMIQTILYFNPFVKAFARIIEGEREKTCDNIVLQFQYEPHGYASALLALEKEARQLQVLTIPAFTGNRNELLARIESIMGVSRQERFSAGRLGRTLAAFGCCLVFFTVVLLSHPSRTNALDGRMAKYLSPFLVYPDNETGNRENVASVMITSPSSPVSAVNPVRPSGSSADIHHDTDEEPENPEEVQPMFASYTADPAVPLAAAEEHLSTEQLHQVKIAVQSARKVMEEIKWKDLEVSIADAMTLAQKEVAKQALQQKVEAQDWDKMEDKLKDSYSRINWPEINKNLSNAMVQIRYDSLQQVYNLALNSLATLEKTLDKTETKSIPDTDITLKLVKEKKSELIQATEQIKKAKAKKIIQL
ncbi:MAG: M56 family metallopeptidase [Chitinophagaceae bacterium]|nr:MAG: M56 family metallopeptidase [Chitinophagaceae bacterium]